MHPFYLFIFNQRESRAALPAGPHGRKERRKEKRENAKLPVNHGINKKSTVGTRVPGGQPIQVWDNCRFARAATVCVSPAPQPPRSTASLHSCPNLMTAFRKCSFLRTQTQRGPGEGRETGPRVLLPDKRRRLTGDFWAAALTFRCDTLRASQTPWRLIKVQCFHVTAGYFAGFEIIYLGFCFLSLLSFEPGESGPLSLPPQIPRITPQSQGATHSETLEPISILLSLFLIKPRKLTHIN